MMKLQFTRKTWYCMLLVAAALSMADGFGLLAGMDFRFFETIAFGCSGLAVLFLAAQKAPGAADAGAVRLGQKHGTPAPQAGAYFGCFAALLVSYILFGSALALRLTVFWPVLAAIEYKRGMPVRQQLRLLVFIEILQAAALLAANRGVAGFSVLAALFWILTCAARGWAALVLYRAKEPDAP